MLSGNFAEMTTSTSFRDLLHAAIYGMGPTALLPLRRKACWGFSSPLKIRRLRPGLNPRTWVLKASTLPLDHRSRWFSYILFIIIIGGILVLFIYITRLASNEILSPSNKIHREVGRAKDSSAFLYLHSTVCFQNMQISKFSYTMKHSNSWQANSLLASQEINRIL